jgi:hypothetical protein
MFKVYPLPADFIPPEIYQYPGILKNLGSLEYGEIIEIFKSIARFHLEKWTISHDLVKNDFLTTDANFEILNQMIVSSNGLGLGFSTISNLFESFDSKENWSKSADVLTFELDSANKTEGLYSFYLELKKGKNEILLRKNYSLLQDWSNYDYLVFDAKMASSEGLNIAVRIKNSGVNYDTPFIFFDKQSWGNIIFDISYIPRNRVNEFSFLFKTLNLTQNAKINIDNGRQNVENFYSNGYAVTKTFEFPANVREVFLDTYNFVYQDTSIIFDISLDDGSHWQSNIPLEIWFEPFPDTGDWSLKNKVKLKIKLSTNNSKVSPVVDDYLLLVKLEV